MGSEKSRPESWEPAWMKYIDEDSQRNVAVLREKGYSIWSVVRSYVSCDKDLDRTLADYGGELTAEELQATLSYYRANQEVIDRKLEEIFT